jgi:4-hydroxy-4-methyl-2-oxoglutarate aldolase
MRATITKSIRRPEEKWINSFKELPASILSDCLNRTHAMNSDIRPVFENIRICGSAVTIESMAGNNLMSHIALTYTKPGDVLVIDAKGAKSPAVWGGIQTLYARKRGVAGVVIDGVVRDIEDIRKMRFPVYCKGTTPAGPHKGWADSVNVPVQCGGVPVHPGDLVVGDDDGVVIVPFSRIEEVYEEAVRRLKTEEKWIKDIENGQSSLEAVGLTSTLKQFDIQYYE